MARQLYMISAASSLLLVAATTVTLFTDSTFVHAARIAAELPARRCPGWADCRPSVAKSHECPAGRFWSPDARACLAADADLSKAAASSPADVATALESMVKAADGCVRDRYRCNGVCQPLWRGCMPSATDAPVPACADGYRTCRASCIPANIPCDSQEVNQPAFVAISGGVGCAEGYVWCNGACYPIYYPCSSAEKDSGATSVDVAVGCADGYVWCNGACYPIYYPCSAKHDENALAAPAVAVGCAEGYVWCNGACYPIYYPCFAATETDGCTEGFQPCYGSCISAMLQCPHATTTTTAGQMTFCPKGFELCSGTCRPSWLPCLASTASKAEAGHLVCPHLRQWCPEYHACMPDWFYCGNYTAVAN